MSKIKKIVLGIIGVISAIVGFFLLSTSAKKQKTNAKISKNTTKVKQLETQIQQVNATKEVLKAELTDLTSKAVVSSTRVTGAKKNAKKNDQTITDLEAALAEAEKKI
jgi:outer membrane murein-binding lipoprotein Lpp